MTKARQRILDRLLARAEKHGDLEGTETRLGDVTELLKAGGVQGGQGVTGGYVVAVTTYALFYAAQRAVVEVGMQPGVVTYPVYRAEIWLGTRWIDEEVVRGCET